MCGKGPCGLPCLLSFGVLLLGFPLRPSSARPLPAPGDLRVLIKSFLSARTPRSSFLFICRAVGMAACRPPRLSGVFCESSQAVPVLHLEPASVACRPQSEKLLILRGALGPANPTGLGLISV